MIIWQFFQVVIEAGNLLLFFNTDLSQFVSEMNGEVVENYYFQKYQRSLEFADYYAFYFLK